MTYTHVLDENEILPDGFSLEDLAGFDTINDAGVVPSGVESFDADASLLASEATFALSTDTWTDQALCRNTPDASLFFSEELIEIAAAKRICGECPVMAQCLEGALDRAEPCGVWGGQLFLNGQVVTQKRRRGRPPKVARPEDQLPDIPVPAHLQARVQGQLQPQVQTKIRERVQEKVEATAA